MDSSSNVQFSARPDGYNEEGGGGCQGDNEVSLVTLCEPRKWRGVSERCAIYPGEAKMKTRDDNTPLHIACSKKAPDHAIAALIEAVPEAISWESSNKGYPLHNLCQLPTPLLGGGWGGH
mmetsp:Transcript_34789/g.103773  ORF Transcript_34789/g.103773 Transcript_34789/m.103773 type:complete len:120 (-) Transcript_34789:974-1333(-)